MAKVTGPLGSSEARGAVGDRVYGSWRGFNVVRSRVTPKNEISGLRIPMQNLMRTWAPLWATLDPQTRQAWYDFAAQHVEPDWTGQDLQLPAWNWWIRTQIRRDHDSLPASDLPPDSACLTDITTLLFYNSVGYLTLEWLMTPDDDLFNYRLEAWLTHAHSPGRKPTLHDAHWLNIYAASDIATTITVPAPGYYTLFIRPIHASGMAGNWSRITAYKTADP